MTVSGVRSDPMAEDGYRTENNISISSEGSSSKDININNINQGEEEEEDGGWLRLSLGSGHHRGSPSPSHNHQISLPGSTSSGGHETWSLTLTTPQHQRQQQQQQQQLTFQVTDFRSITKPPPMFYLQPHRGGMAAAIDSSSSHHQQYYDNNNYLPLTALSTPSSLGKPPLSIDFRVVDPPPRPYSGVWFILQASQTQTKEPYLPQVQKSYLRIKDGRTPVGLLIKYLVYKLKLDGEFEIEIRCKGQQLLPFLSLQHVRDNIWNRPQKDVVFINSAASASMDHLMVLHYGRIA